ncbi:MAG: hypothetical protein WCD53_01750 [Microcoleus sp.]
MSSDRLRHVEKNLTCLRQQLEGKENTLTTIAPEERKRIEQQIDDLKKLMRPVEEEYWQILANQPEETAISVADPAPEVVVAEIVDRVGQLQASPQYSHNDLVLQLLQDIDAKVSEDKSAAAKLKGVVSLLPPFLNLSYDVELDTENFLQRHFPTFRRWSNALAKKS